MKVVKVAASTLAAPFASSDAAFTLLAFKDSQGNDVALGDFGAEAYFIVVLKQGNTTEMVKCSNVVINADGTATFTVAATGRDILPKYPWTGAATGQDFSAGADAIVTNDPLTMSRFAALAEANTFSALNIFSIVPQTTADPVNNNDLARKSWILSLVLGNLTTINLIIPGTAGATIAAGNLVYLDTATGRWKLADASNAATVNNTLLAIAQGAGTNGNPISGGILLQGVDTHQTGLTLGNVEYATNTPGAIGAAAGTTVVAVGVAKSATDVYFEPRFDQQLTNDQMAALAGNSGTPSSGNRFVTEAYIATITALNPAGSVHMWAGIAGLVPSGYLLCDGSAVSRATYAALWAALNPSLGAVTVTIASPGVLSLTAHGLKEGDTVYLTTTGALPTGLSANTLYYVIAAGLTANAFELSATRGGSVINTSGVQSGVHTLLRTPYGLGDGSTTFNLPNFAGKVPVGRDATDKDFALGETGGEKTHTLTLAEAPSHSHSVTFYTGGGGPAVGIGGSTPAGSGGTDAQGGGGAHNNLQPYAAINFIIKT